MRVYGLNFASGEGTVCIPRCRGRGWLRNSAEPPCYQHWLSNYFEDLNLALFNIPGIKLEALSFICFVCCIHAWYIADNYYKWGNLHFGSCKERIFPELSYGHNRCITPKVQVHWELYISSLFRDRKGEHPWASVSSSVTREVCACIGVTGISCLSPNSDSLIFSITVKIPNVTYQWDCYSFLKTFEGRDHVNITPNLSGALT